jgi:hypothetical protein
MPINKRQSEDLEKLLEFLSQDTNDELKNLSSISQYDENKQLLISELKKHVQDIDEKSDDKTLIKNATDLIDSYNPSLIVRALNGFINFFNGLVNRVNNFISSLRGSSIPEQEKELVPEPEPELETETKSDTEPEQELEQELEQEPEQEPEQELEQEPEQELEQELEQEPEQELEQELEQEPDIQRLESQRRTLEREISKLQQKESVYQTQISRLEKALETIKVEKSPGEAPISDFLNRNITKKSKEKTDNPDLNILEKARANWAKSTRLLTGSESVVRDLNGVLESVKNIDQTGWLPSQKSELEQKVTIVRQTFDNERTELNNIYNKIRPGLINNYNSLVDYLNTQASDNSKTYWAANLLLNEVHHLINGMDTILDIEDKNLPEPPPALDEYIKTEITKGRDSLQEIKRKIAPKRDASSKVASQIDNLKKALKAAAAQLSANTNRSSAPPPPPPPPPTAPHSTPTDSSTNNLIPHSTHSQEPKPKEIRK